MASNSVVASVTLLTASSKAFLGASRGRLHAAHLAHVLTGGGFDLLGGRRGLEAAKGRDVPAHESKARASSTMWSESDEATARWGEAQAAA